MKYRAFKLQIVEMPNLMINAIDTSDWINPNENTSDWITPNDKVFSIMVFCEEKEIITHSNNEETTLIHSRFIDEKFYSVTRKIRNDGVCVSKSQNTNMKTAICRCLKEEDIEDFKKQWENGWDVEEAKKSEDVRTRELESNEAQKWEDFKNIWENELVVSDEQVKKGIFQKLKWFFPCFFG